MFKLPELKRKVDAVDIWHQMFDQKILKFPSLVVPHVVGLSNPYRMMMPIELWLERVALIVNP